MLNNCLSVLCNNAKVGVFVSFFFLYFGGGCRKNSGCLRGGGVKEKMKATQGECTKFIHGLLQILPAHPTR